MIFDGVETDAAALRYLLVGQTVAHGIYCAPFGWRKQVVMWRASPSFGHVPILTAQTPIYPPLFSEARQRISAD